MLFPSPFLLALHSPSKSMTAWTWVLTIPKQTCTFENWSSYIFFIISYHHVSWLEINMLDNIVTRPLVVSPICWAKTLQTALEVLRSTKVAFRLCLVFRSIYFCIGLMIWNSTIQNRSCFDCRFSRQEIALGSCSTFSSFCKQWELRRGIFFCQNQTQIPVEAIEM